MSLKFETSGHQIDGARDYQEDSFLTSHLQAGEGNTPVTLAIVADGMGGHAAGNVASNLAVQAFNKYITSHYTGELIDALLRRAMEEANNSIRSAIEETQALKGMGCTLVAALLIGDQMYWCSVGDSHLFHFQDDRLIKRNADHSYGGYIDRMAVEGKPVTPENGYSRHMLLSALTGEPIPTIDSSEDQPATLTSGEMILLCSDGIDTLSSKQIRSACQEVDEPRALSTRLLDEVDFEDYPRQDNTTVISIKVHNSDKQTKVKITPVKPPVIQNRPSHTVQASYSPPPRQSWFFPLCLIVVLCGAVWIYLEQKTAKIAELALAEKLSTLAPQQTPITPLQNSAKVEPDKQESVEKKAAPIKKFNDTLSNGSLGPEMLMLPADSFKMGATASTSHANELPQHEVQIKAFAISSKEITRAEFARYSRISVSKANSHQPVRKVSWKTAKKYTAWLSKQTGQIYRLPSEAEWEYAARAGSQTPFWWGHNIGVDNALCFGCGTPLEPTRPKDVGSYAANAFGLYDTAGNLAEWVEDCYHGNYQNAPNDGSPWHNKECKERVIRGGAYTNTAKSLFVTRRTKLAEKKSKEYIGFRVVREL